LATDNKTAYHCYLAGHSLYVLLLSGRLQLIFVYDRPTNLIAARYFNPPVELQKAYIKQLAEDLGANFGLKKVLFLVAAVWPLPLST